MSKLTPEEKSVMSFARQYIKHGYPKNVWWQGKKYRVLERVSHESQMYNKVSGDRVCMIDHYSRLLTARKDRDILAVPNYRSKPTEWVIYASESA